MSSVFEPNLSINYWLKIYQVKDIMVLCSNSISGKKVEVEAPTNHVSDRNLTQQLEMGGFLFIFDMFMPFLQYTLFQPLYLDKERGWICGYNKYKCLWLGHLLLKKSIDNDNRLYVLLQVLKLVVIFTLSMFLFSPVSNLCVKIFQFITI